MKKFAIVLAFAVLLAFPVFAAAQAEVAGPASFVPTKNIEWYVTSSPGGGSDIFTRNLMDIMVSDKLVNDQNIVIQYKTDGAGEVGRLLVSNIKAGSQADHTLLTFNSGDLMPMAKNTNNRFENFQPIAHLAVDKHLIFVGEGSAYKNFEEVIAALKAGKNITLAGSKGDDIACHAALIKELGVSEDQFAYIAHDASSGAITAILGNHYDLLICKPAAASQYVEAGKIKPILALSTSRFPGNLSSAPTLKELGYKNVEVPNWRSVVGPKSMSAEAVAYWSDVFKQVSTTDAWTKGYIEKQKLVPEFMDHNVFKAYGTQFQAEYLASIGKDK
ncbi:tripartite tricarboxylate transporter substrate-binding protein [Sphaerochaeta sp. PS]|uniref:Bug family tripartite tricarboxylate transporter substrate binding protein n=1 Tax=Sphaerochaeta sp. PS TaxID=3076336 RepID=UPI0028A4FDFE|nr:tripartite tricarboxylate transporter substrate-binding protein [Sphaerochaeta sp. PS]MDT4763000.1 tripartite tricarboxylate transporter substrate-binding protein [Sphaerochaeta sp. PS]